MVLHQNSYKTRRYSIIELINTKLYNIHHDSKYYYLNSDGFLIRKDSLRKKK